MHSQLIATFLFIVLAVAAPTLTEAEHHDPLRMPLLAFTAAAVTVAAKPIIVRDSPVSLPIARRFNLTGVPSILKQDQAGAKALKGRSQSSKAKGPSLKQAAIFNVDATNQAVDYVVSVGVGTPPTFYDLLIDTGSSNTWVGADKSYVKTSTSKSTNQSVVSINRSTPRRQHK